MSVGYYNHTFETINRFAKTIKYEYDIDFKIDQYHFRDGNEVKEEKDLLESRLKKHRKQIKSEIKSLVEDLRSVAERSKNLELFLDNDITSDEYIEKIDGQI